MTSQERTYIAIDLKSFYASVECRERNLDPLTTNLVVADSSRTEKTICLAVSPSLKSYGIPGRPRLFEVIQKIKVVNASRLQHAPCRTFTGESFDDVQLKTMPELAVSYIATPPRMALYMKYSTQIYNVYLTYVAPEDIHVYSIDEVFIDASGYLKTYGLTPQQFAQRMIQDVLMTTGITATAGIGTNLYLAKIAMDLGAKHSVPDENGVRIATLDEFSYRRLFWSHKPITDFWRVGRGYQKKLEEVGLFTMGDIARCSLGRETDFYNEDLLYQLFGVNAELLIDHAWGYEPCTLKEVKAYKPQHNSVGSGQVLKEPYPFEKGKLVVQEMTELLMLSLVEKQLVSDQIVLTVGYDKENLVTAGGNKGYQGALTTDRYGRTLPKPVHGTTNLREHTASTQLALDAVMKLFDHIVNPKLLIRKIQISANHVIKEKDVVQKERDQYCQLDLFTDYEAVIEKQQVLEEKLKREKQMQLTMLEIKNKFGKNAILKGTNFKEGANTRERNMQIGGHKA